MPNDRQAHDPVNHPDHYHQQGIEVIDVIEAYELPYHLGNVIKYVCRHSYKGQPLKDLQKALWYLARYVEDLEDVAVVEALEDDSWKTATPMEEVLKNIEEADCLYEEGLCTSEERDLFYLAPSDRIAGDNEAARKIKDAYYGYNRYEIQGYCANCDKELKAGAGYLKQEEYPDQKFCSVYCIDKLKAWYESIGL